MSDTRIDQYLAHLKSEEWQKIKALVHHRTQGCCTFCGQMATATHHLKYPKQFRDDSVFSNVPVCDGCHKKLHAILDLDELRSPRIKAIPNAKGALINLLVEGDSSYASIENWCKAMCVPNSQVAWFRFQFERHFVINTDFAPKTYQGKPVYRWECARKTISEWHDQHIKSPPKWNAPDVADRHQFEDCYQGILTWLESLGARELAASSSTQLVSAESGGITQRTLLDLTERFAQAIAPRLHQHDAKIAEHDVVIGAIKEAAPFLRDLTECITVEEGAIELGMNHGRLPYPSSKLTLAQVVGNRLASSGVARGPKQRIRLEPSAIITEVNTYKRGDVYAALREINGKSQKERDVGS